MRYSERVTPVVRFDQGSRSILMSAHYASATFGKLWNADPSGHCRRLTWRKTSAEPCWMPRRLLIGYGAFGEAMIVSSFFLQWGAKP